MFRSALACSFIGLATGLAAPDATEAIRRADDALRPGKSFIVEARIEFFRNRTPAGSMTLKTAVRLPEEEALALATEPEAERGKAILRQAGGAMWLLDPGASRAVRFDGRQRLQGDASLEDLLPVRLTADYTPTAEGEESITNAAGQPVVARRFALEARSKSAPYTALRLWTDGLGDHPVKLECRASGGRVLRTVFFDRYRGILGAERPTEWTIVDGAAPGRVTRIRFSGYRHRDWPGDLFYPDRLRESAAALTGETGAG